MRSRLQRHFPTPTFAEDLRTGNLDQLRLLPTSPHTLLLQRALPGFFYRLQSMSLWLPVYALWGSWMGLPILEVVGLWGLISFLDYKLLFLLGFYLLLPFEPVRLAYLLALIAVYSLTREEASTSLSSSRFFDLLLRFWLAFSILLRLTLGLKFSFALPALLEVALLSLWLEMARADKLARWLNPPGGWWRFFHLLPLGALLLTGQGIAWEWLRALPATPEERFTACMVITFLLGGWLGTVQTNFKRAGRPLQEGFRQHLLESGLNRLLCLLVSLIGGWWYNLDLTQLKNSFWALYLLLLLIDPLAMALAKQGCQKFYCSPHPLLGSRLFILLAALPLICFQIPLVPFPWLSMLSPSLALSTQTPLWHELRRLTAAGSLLSSIPSALPFLLPPLRLGIVASLGFLWGLTAPRRFPIPRPLGDLSRIVQVSPLIEGALLKRAQNPVFRHMVAARQRYGMGFFHLLGVLIGLLGGLATLMVGSCLAGPIFAVLWYLSYQSVQSYLRRLIETGEFRHWLLTPLTNREIYWGLIYGGWWWQLRWGILILVSLTLGSFLRVLLSPLLPSLLLTSGTAGGGSLLLVTIQFGMGFMGLLTVVVFLGVALLIAVPMAIQDSLSGVRQASGGASSQRAFLLATLWGLLSCCYILAPLSLIGLPVFSQRALNMLHQIRRTPDKYLPR